MKKTNCILALALVLLGCFFALPGRAQTNAPSASAAKTCAGILTVPTQYNTIQDAIAASCAGATISIAAGTYTASLTLHHSNSGITIAGAGSDKTIIKGSNAPVFSLDDLRNVALRDVTLQAGGNKRTEGGGLWISRSSDVQLENCRITGNASAQGAGISVNHSSSISVRRCVIDQNTALENGGGILVQDNSRIELENATIANNKSNACFGLGLEVTGGSASVKNTIIWQNSTTRPEGFCTRTTQSYGTPAITHSDIQGGFAGTGVIDRDPLFLSSMSGDLRLSTSSPAINAGDPAQTDPDGSRVDIGAYPFQSARTLGLIVANIPPAATSTPAAAATSTPAAAPAPTQSAAPSSLSIAGSLMDERLKDAWAVAIASNRAYVATNGTNDGVVVLDISSKEKPVILGSVKDAERLKGPAALAISGNYVYVSASRSSRLTIIDVSKPTAPRIVGSVSDPKLNGGWGLALSGKYAYVTSISGSSLTVVDVSKPAAPRVVGTLTSPELKGAYGVAASGQYAYVAAAYANRLVAVDISRPASMRIVGFVSDATRLKDPWAVALAGKYAYVTSAPNDRLTIIDVSKPTTPVIIGTLQDASWLDGAYSVAVQGKYAFIAAAFASRVTVVDVSNPAAPVVADSLQDTTFLSDITSVAPADAFLYAAGKYNSRLTVIDAPNYAPISLTRQIGGALASLWTTLGRAFAAIFIAPVR